MGAVNLALQQWDGLDDPLDEGIFSCYIDKLMILRMTSTAPRPQSCTGT